MSGQGRVVHPSLDGRLKKNRHAGPVLTRELGNQRAGQQGRVKNPATDRRLAQNRANTSACAESAS